MNYIVHIEKCINKYKQENGILITFCNIKENAIHQILETLNVNNFRILETNQNQLSIYIEKQNIYTTNLNKLLKKLGEIIHQVLN